MTGRIRIALVLLLLSALLVVVAIAALAVGGGAFFLDGVDGSLSARTMLGLLREALGGPASEAGEAARTILWRVRLPQVLLAAVIGGALAVSGGVFQATLRNPLADPLLLGVASGAALAASVAISLGFDGAWVPPVAATAGAGGTLLFVFAIAGRRGHFDPGTMVLAGVIASTFFSAVTLLLLSLTPAQSISRILHWTMGSFADVGFLKLRWAGPALAALILASVAGARPLNLLVLGDESARSAGLATGTSRALLYGLAAALTGVSVAAAGVVGFIGLVVPHLARGLFGADQRLALPASALLGAILCVFSDAVARLAVPAAQATWAWSQGVPVTPAPVELPVGVVTALFGAPFFMVLLVRRQARGLA